jgi:hypothetical protein
MLRDKTTVAHPPFILFLFSGVSLVSQRISAQILVFRCDLWSPSIDAPEMPRLGVGRNTPFAQNSNYHTIYNHCFRDESGYDPSKQVKVKCAYCGVWVRKGCCCGLCGTAAPGYSPAAARPRSPASRSAPHRFEGQTNTSRGAAHLSAMAARSATPTLKGNGAHLSEDRPSRKVKCSYCGIWVECGKICALCRTPSAPY